ncbi:hypothetical protein [Donghicola sp. XS_ASV15]|uniref:DUF6902 family protein n=1 Tax=Donghicola sp. XS_ASV15 TaxID=3241295 RepID=UPI0035139915
MNLAGNILGHRQPIESKAWYEEIIYLLMLLRRCNIPVGQDFLARFRPLYDRLPEMLQFNPRSYAVLLHIAYELERNGIEGDASSGLIRWILSRDLVVADHSDKGRLYGSWMMWQSNVSALGAAGDQSLIRRTIARISRPDFYAEMPMGKDLARSVMILTAMGGLEAMATPAIKTSLRNALFYAFLADDAETASRLISVFHALNMPVPQPVENFVLRRSSKLRISGGLEHGQVDSLKLYMASQCVAYGAGQPVFAEALPNGPFSLHIQGDKVSPMRELQTVLRRMSIPRCGNWPAMKREIEGLLSFPTHNRLEAAAKCDGFDAFFEILSRPGDVM